MTKQSTTTIGDEPAPRIARVNSAEMIGCEIEDLRRQLGAADQERARLVAMRPVTFQADAVVQLEADIRAAEGRQGALKRAIQTTERNHTSAQDDEAATELERKAAEAKKAGQRIIKGLGELHKVLGTINRLNGEIDADWKIIAEANAAVLGGGRDDLRVDETMIRAQAAGLTMLGDGSDTLRVRARHALWGICRNAFRERHRLDLKRGTIENPMRL